MKRKKPDFWMAEPPDELQPAQLDETEIVSVVISTVILAAVAALLLVEWLVPAGK